MRILIFFIILLTIKNQKQPNIINDFFQVVSIMNDVKDTGDWKFAFRHLNKDNVSAQSIRTHPQHNTYDMLLREM